MRERLIFITDRRRSADLVAQLARALAAVPPASALIMVREKDLAGRPLVELTRALIAVAHRSGARLVVNDRADIALAAGADGVHLPEDGFSVDEARSLLPPGSLVGASVHAPAGAIARAGCEYLVAGPIWDTPGKTAIGLEAFAAIVRAAKIPVFAVGGIDVARADAAVQSGAHGVAVIRAIMEAEDPAAIASALCEVFLCI